MLRRPIEETERERRQALDAPIGDDAGVLGAMADGTGAISRSGPGSVSASEKDRGRELITGDFSPAWCC